MSLDFYLEKMAPTEVFSANITHNLGAMATQAGIYKILWRPEENGYKQAHEIINELERGIKEMKAAPDYFRTFDSENGWGTYDDFIPWLEKVLAACKEHPEAKIRTWV